MKNFITYGYIVFLILTGCNIVSKQEKVIAENPLHHVRNRLDSLYNSNYPKNEPGIAVLILYDTLEIFKKGYGVRNINSQAPITPNTNMRSASLAKPITALGILSLIDQDKISLNDTVYNYLKYPVFKNITIRQLLGHTSGIPDAEVVLVDQWDADRPLTNGDILDWYSTNDSLITQPGTKYNYNNGGYYVLAKIIELQSEMTFRDYIQKYVFDVAGMRNTQFVDYPNVDRIKQRALCYEKDSLGNWYSKGENGFYDMPGLGLIGAGGMYTNLNDYENFVFALRSKEIVSEASHDLMFDPISIADQPILFEFEKNQTKKYGMGLWVHDNFALAAGSYVGTDNWVFYDLNKPLTIVFFANNYNLWENKVMNHTYNIVNGYLKTIANTGL